jgi:excisionase family DNA binding protein
MPKASKTQTSIFAKYLRDARNGGFMGTPHEQETPKLLTLKEASAALRVSSWTLFNLINRRQLDTIKIGRRRLVPADSITKLIDELREEAL